MQRAHQHKSLLEIAKLVEKRLLAPEGLKAYHSWISNATYPDAAKAESQVEEMERNWPTFKSDTKLGRIPNFLWQSGESHLLTEGVSEESLRREGASWSQQYEEAAQHTMLRVERLGRRPRCCCMGR